MRIRENSAIRLAGLADRARARGLHEKADKLLLLAWAVYGRCGESAATRRTGGPTATIHQLRRA